MIILDAHCLFICSFASNPSVHSSATDPVLYRFFNIYIKGHLVMTLLQKLLKYHTPLWYLSYIDLQSLPSSGWIFFTQSQYVSHVLTLL